MEGTHGKLGTGFADGLRGNDADCFADHDGKRGRHVLSVALRADAETGVAVENAADVDTFRIFAAVFFHSGNLFGVGFGDHLVAGNDDVPLFVGKIFGSESAR